MTFLQVMPFIIFIILSTTFLATCTDTQESSTSTTTPHPGRAFAHLRVLAEKIGVRAAGTISALEAAEYISEQFKAAGYVVTIGPFTATFNKDTSAILIEDQSKTIAALAMTGSPQGEMIAPVVFAGLGKLDEITSSNLKNMIVLLNRGVLTFEQKARNAQSAGAIGVVIINNEPSTFRGTLGDNFDISTPVLAVSGRFEATLRSLAQDRATITIRSEFGHGPWSSQNVVGRSPGKDCTAYLGAHYDSVPQSPGANDNASGVAILI